MAQQNPAIFTGGQMTDLPAYPGGDFAGGELFEIVSPGTAAAGINYRITAAVLAAKLQILIGAGSPTFVDDAPLYNSVATDTRILVRNTAPLSTSIVLLGAAAYSLPILVKDLTGLATDVNPITVTFTGGETMDGLAQVQIMNPYGYFWFNPLAAGNFYES